MNASHIALILIGILALFAQMARADLLGGATIEPARVQEIAAALPEDGFALGPKIDDRAAWARLASTKAYRNIVHEAERLLATPMPAMTEDVFMEYKRTGERTRNYAVTRNDRYSRLSTFTLAECIENKGRFIQPLEQAIASICEEPTWDYNFHDPNLENWNRKIVGIDLGAVVPAHDMAELSYLLGERLSKETRKLIQENVRRRILDPYRNAVEQKTKPSWAWWITSDINWSAVCHCGVVGCALEFGKDRQERAWFIAATEHYLQGYLRAFGPDGYCAEGLGYWSYGFGNYINAAELVLQATSGKVDWYANPGAREVALYPPKMEIMHGIWPAYADCALNPRPSEIFMSFLNRRYGFGLSEYHVSDFTTASGGLFYAMLYSNPNSATKAPPATQRIAYSIRTFFEHGGVLTCRPAENSKCRIGVSIKGGFNAEPHNHNDLGTFVVVVDDQPLIVDPGGEVYTARTFSKDRYKSNLINSFGHPVPLVAGQLQRTGKDARALILSHHFTDDADSLVQDLRSAYAVKELKKLERSFAYHRDGAGSLVVKDEFAFDSPQAFGAALVTYGQWKQISENELTILWHGKACGVKFDTGGKKLKFSAKAIEERTISDKFGKPTRIGYDLAEPAEQGAIILTITPE